MLPGIDHILRIRVVSDIEYRLQHVMRKLGLSRSKARQYIEQVEDDRRKWVKKFYNVDWDVFTLYDLILNLSQVNVDNAASAICSLAQLPDFQATPASINALEDLYLAAKARLMLAGDTRTRRMNVKVRANNRVVYVTYLSQELKEPELLTEILGGPAQAREIICTKAATNILWIQESFELSDSTFYSVEEIKERYIQFLQNQKERFVNLPRFSGHIEKIVFLTLEVTETSLKIAFSCLSICYLSLNGSVIDAVF